MSKIIPNKEVYAKQTNKHNEQMSYIIGDFSKIKLILLKPNLNCYWTFRIHTKIVVRIKYWGHTVFLNVVLLRMNILHVYIYLFFYGHFRGGRGRGCVMVISISYCDIHIKYTYLDSFFLHVTSPIFVSKHYTLYLSFYGHFRGINIDRLHI